MSSVRKILIVEDEPLIAMMLEDFLDSLGHEVIASADNVDDALVAADRGGFDLAVLDVNLRGTNVWPVAERLSSDGIPFVLATGGHVDKPPEEFSDYPLLQKPYTLDRVAEVITGMTAKA